MPNKVFIVLAMVALLFILPNTLISDDFIYTMKEGAPMAHKKEDLLLMVNMIIDKDFLGIQKLLDSNRVFQAKSGVRVSLYEHDDVNKIVKVRIMGELPFFWTIPEALLTE